MRGDKSSKKSKKCNTKPTKCVANDSLPTSKDTNHVIEGNELVSSEPKLFNILTQKINENGNNNCQLFCIEKIRSKLESVLNGFTCECPSDHLDGGEIRRRIQEEKCVSQNSLRDIKIFLTNALTLSVDASLCTLASKLLRVFIDLLEVAQNEQLEFTIQSCDVVITIHEYFILVGEASGGAVSAEKLIAMLHHVIKQLYKKQHIDGVVLIIKNMINLIHVIGNNNITLADEPKRWLCVIHQMCYSLYYKELQNLIKSDNISTDVTSLFHLRVGSLIVLSSSGWKENKFVDHLINFINKEYVILVQSVIFNKQIVSVVLIDLLHTFYRLINLETNERRVLLTNALWKFVNICVDFCSRNQLYELSHTFTSKADGFLNDFTEELIVLEKSSDLCKVLRQCRCLCFCKESGQILEYPVHVTTYFNMYFGNKISDISRLFDILVLLKTNFKDVTQMCGSVINVLIQVLSFATKTLLKRPASEQKGKTSALLSFVCNLFVHVKSQLFVDSSSTLQCFAKHEVVMSSFNTLYNEYIAVLKSFLSEQNNLNQEDFKWLVALLYKVGVHYYNLKQYNFALPSLELSIFLFELCIGNVDVICLKDLMKRYTTVCECYSKLHNNKECHDTYVQSIRCFGRLTSEQLNANRSLLEAQVKACVKKNLDSTLIGSGSLPITCIVDEFSKESGVSGFISLVLEFEYYVYKELRRSDVRDVTERLFFLRKDQYEKGGQMLEYALCMVEMSTCLTFQHEERFHWCSDAVGLVEELHENLDCSGDEFEWHVCDVLAVCYFQISVLKYEGKVMNSMEKVQHNISNLLEEGNHGSRANSDNEFYDDCMLEEDYEEKQFITYLNEAMKMWTKVIERAVECDSGKESRMIFHDAEGAAKCLYQASIFYSLLSQNLNSAKASYLSGLVYQMLATENIVYQEKQVAAWALTASQFLLTKDTSSGEEILQKLQGTKNCSVFSNLHIEVLRAAYMLYSGNVQSSAESFQCILDNEALSDNTKSALVIKSDIYFLLSYLKLVPLKENNDANVSLNEHFPSKSPFPPISDCLKYLRSLYSKYVEGTSAQVGDVMISSNWAYLDKLLVCLTRNAELLKQQGSILEAKSLLKEALHLTLHHHLSLRTVDILQQMASMDLILKNKDAFNTRFEIISKFLAHTIENCFCEKQVMLPFFVNHDSHCTCNYCNYPKLQKTHIVLYKQYFEGKQHFSQLTPEEYDSAVSVIDMLVENAYSRYITSVAVVHKIVTMSFPYLEKVTASDLNSHEVKDRKKVVSKNKSAVSKKSKKGDRELFNMFLLYSFEAKINQSLAENQDVMKILEEGVSKLHLSNGCAQANHEYHRLCAQFFHLKALVCLDGDVVENMWCLESKNVNPEVFSKAQASEPNACIGANVEDKKLRKTKSKSKITAYETPVKPVRRVKQKGIRKGRLYEETDNTVEMNSKSIRINSSNKVDTLECLEDLRKSLEILNPYTDTLIIKAIYKLLILLSGTSNKTMTIACHLLSSSRILHQQMLSLCGKKLQNKKLLTSALDSKEKSILETTSNLLEKFSDPNLVFEQDHVQSLMDDHVPEHWVICSLTLMEVERKRYLIVSRLQQLMEPVVVKINLSDKIQECRGENKVDDLARAFDSVDLLEKFNSLMEKSEESMKITETKLWWSERVRLDKELKSTISCLEEDWLQGWKGMLLGQCRDSEQEIKCNSITEEVIADINSAINKNAEKGLIKCLLDGFEYCTRYQVIEALQTLYGENDAEVVYDIFVRRLERSKQNDIKKRLFDEGGEQRRQPVRKPVVLVLDKTLQKLPWESMDILCGQPVTRMPSLLLTLSHCKNYKNEIMDGVTIEKCCYVLNPKDDLKRTEEKFSNWFKDEGWQGIVGRPPTSAEYSDAISENDLFIYCGHGSGQEYLGWSSVQRLQSHAVALLMGCSSGKLLVQGELEAHGMVLYYLSAGCPVVVANLWHVTDRDIDLFLEKLLILWLTEGRGSNLAECVAKARQACKLEYLNGAAPVVYGLPLFVKDV